MIDARKWIWIPLACLALGLVVGAVGSQCDWTPVSVVVPVEPVKPDRVVYVYEQRDGSIPPGVQAGLNQLNRQGIEATPFEQNTTDGTGEVPEQYKLALAAARDHGLPALVVLGNGKVLKVIIAPTTTDVVVEGPFSFPPQSN